MLRRTTNPGCAAAVVTGIAFLLAATSAACTTQPDYASTATNSAAAGSSSTPPVHLAGPANTLPGEFNEEAFTEASAYTGLPLLSLGRTFANLNLVYFDHRVTPVPLGASWKPDREATQVAGLVYGTCEPKLVGDELSCPAPLSIAINGPGLSPPVDQMELHAGWSTPYEVRGVPAIDVETGTILFFENGVTITVHSDSDIRQKAIQALQLANAEALGMQEIGPGEDLSPLDGLRIPELGGQ